MQIFYINLAARTDRRAFMERQFAALGLAGERIEAVTPATLSADQRALYRSRAARSMTEIEFACNISHMQCWRALQAGGESQALVFEDDAILSRSLPRFLAALETADLRLPLIRIETRGLPIRAFPVETQVLPDVALRRALHHDAGAGGYVVSRAAAADLLASPQMATTLVDGLLFNPFSDIGNRLAVRYADPGLSIQLVLAGQGESGPGVSDLTGSRAVRPRDSYPLRLARKALSWVTYDARAAWTRLASGAWRHRPAIIPFKPD